MIVYRLEEKGRNTTFDNVGDGVYTGRAGLHSYAATDSGNPETHPNPCNDSSKLAEAFNNDYVCCFHSLEELHRWFDCLATAEERIQAKMQIATYTVPNEDTITGRFQAIALASSMVRVELHPVTYGYK